jgi:hypothetical protein
MDASLVCPVLKMFDQCRKMTARHAKSQTLVSLVALG